MVDTVRNVIRKRHADDARSMLRSRYDGTVRTGVPPKVCLWLERFVIEDDSSATSASGLQDPACKHSSRRESPSDAGGCGRTADGWVTPWHWCEGGGKAKRPQTESERTSWTELLGENATHSTISISEEKANLHFEILPEVISDLLPTASESTVSEKRSGGRSVPLAPSTALMLYCQQRASLWADRIELHWVDDVALHRIAIYRTE